MSASLIRLRSPLLDLLLFFLLSELAFSLDLLPFLPPGDSSSEEEKRRTDQMGAAEELRQRLHLHLTPGLSLSGVCWVKIGLPGERSVPMKGPPQKSPPRPFPAPAPFWPHSHHCRPPCGRPKMLGGRWWARWFMVAMEGCHGTARPSAVEGKLEDAFGEAVWMTREGCRRAAHPSPGSPERLFIMSFKLVHLLHELVDDPVVRLFLPLHRHNVLHPVLSQLGAHGLVPFVLGLGHLLLLFLADVVDLDLVYFFVPSLFHQLVDGASAWCCSATRTTCCSLCLRYSSWSLATNGVGVSLCRGGKLPQCSLPLCLCSMPQSTHLGLNHPLYMQLLLMLLR